MPLGFRSPSADLSAATLELIEELGFLYDSSLMTDDYRPFHPRIGDRVARGVPLERGREARFWELPMCFELDDWVHFQFNFDPYRKGGATPSQGARDLARRVRLHGRERRRRRAHLCMHPQVIGRGHRIAMLDELIGHCRDAGARFERMADVARGSASSGSRSGGARTRRRSGR